MLEKFDVAACLPPREAAFFAAVRRGVAVGFAADLVGVPRRHAGQMRDQLGRAVMQLRRRIVGRVVVRARPRGRRPQGFGRAARGGRSTVGSRDGPERPRRSSPGLAGLRPSLLVGGARA